jgi:hypothetical protein
MPSVVVIRAVARAPSEGPPRASTRVERIAAMRACGATIVPFLARNRHSVVTGEARR